ncbi:MAG TPA: hypothetical protein VJH75_00005 [Patescibacteria group bacterium]|nr:hypothetical protein [Patescibacteria group bacterium]
MYFVYDKKVNAWSGKVNLNVLKNWGVSEYKTKKVGISVEMVDLFSGYLNTWMDNNIAKVLKTFFKITKIIHRPADFKYYINLSSISLHHAKENFISIGIAHPFSNYPTIIIHELFHLYFYQYIYWDEFLKRFGLKSVNDFIDPEEQNELKEILTVIINEEFKKFIVFPDEGYPKHRALRRIARASWTKEKDFGKLVMDIGKLLKNNDEGRQWG